MQSSVQILLVMAAIVAHTYGIRCWTCYNAVGSQDCMRKGELRTCDENEQMCFSSVRNVDGRWEVEKRCKQPKACENNHIQNPRDAYARTQCNPEIQGSVCRCCCGTDACNQEGLFCLRRKYCPSVPELVNGYVHCDYSENATEIGSICHFSCKAGYTLVGELTSECANTHKGEPAFNRPVPVCRATRTHCLVQTGIANGAIACNQDGIALGTTCGFTCNPGYFLNGADSNMCISTGNGLEWSQPAPTCEPIICIPEQTAPVGGSVDCTTNTLGTVCTFSCNDGSTLLGSNSTECIEDFGPFGKWSEPTPDCMADFSDAPAIPCSVVKPIGNGKTICDAKNEECIFICDDGFGMHGTDAIVCNADGTWSDSPPRCLALACGPLTQIAHGSMACTDDNNVKSKCSFTCTKNTGRQIYPADVIENQCSIQPDGTAAWIPAPPCCGHPCPPFVIMDLVVVLDSSSSVKLPNWEVQVEFTKLVIKQFELGADSARMSIFRYNSEIDEDTEIKLKDTIGKNMTQVVNLLNKIPYNGSGTRTGLALRHVQKKSLSADYGNRAEVQDVVLVITDGKAENPKLVKEVAGELRDEGVLIFAVGIGLDPIVFQKLVKMTGSESRTINVKDFGNLLSGGFVEKLGKRLCHDPCA